MIIDKAFFERKIDGNHHLGHLLLECFKTRRPDAICQIDAGTGEEETYSSVLNRSIRLARCLRRAGLQPGDVVTFGGRNHLDLRIPFYAATFNGLPIVGVDPLFKYAEIKAILKITEPKVCFCQYSTYEVYAQAVEDLGIDVKIVTFDEGECTLAKFMDDNDVDENEEFIPASFDTDKVYAWLVSTSGTTGVPKLAAIKHEAVFGVMKNALTFGTFGSVTTGKQKLGFNVSPPQWISSYANAYLMPFTSTCLLQTSQPSTPENIINAINIYKPSSMLLSPSLLSHLLKYEKPCDFTCFDNITIGGAKLYQETLIAIRSRVREGAIILDAYAQTEAIGPILGFIPTDGPFGSYSSKHSLHQIKLVDPDSGDEIIKPHTNGELWSKGPGFTEYYKDPSETANTITQDGWVRTGDLFYKDENGYYFFVERLKMLIKYRNIQVIPPELEEVILTHPGILEVGVTSVPDPDDGQRPVAVVVKKSNDITAQEIKDLVAGKLSESKQLRGGVVFVDELPKTSTGKVHRVKLQEFVLTAKRE